MDTFLGIFDANPNSNDEVRAFSRRKEEPRGELGGGRNVLDEAIECVGLRVDADFSRSADTSKKTPIMDVATTFTATRIFHDKY